MVESYSSAKILVSTSQIPNLTPLILSANSILALHCSQAPNTLNWVELECMFFASCAITLRLAKAKKINNITTPFLTMQR